MRRPPPVQLAAYRLLGRQLGPSYRDWVHDDLTRRGWFARVVLPPMALELGVGTALFLALGGDPARLLALVAVLVGGLAFLRGNLQRLLLEHHEKEPSLRDAVLFAVASLAVLVVLAVRSS